MPCWPAAPEFGDPPVFPLVPLSQAHARRAAAACARRWGRRAAFVVVWGAAAVFALAAGLVAAYGRDNPRWKTAAARCAAAAGAMVFTAVRGIRHSRRAAPAATRPWPAGHEAWLAATCAYYRALDTAERAAFRARMDELAAAAPIHWAFDPGVPNGGGAAEQDDGNGDGGDGCGGDREEEGGAAPLPEPDATRLRVLASGAMLGFGFAAVDWRALGLREIVLRPHAFDGGWRVDGAGLLTEFEESGALGEEGMENGVVMLAVDDLADDWARPADGHNVALHEFAHLADAVAGSRLEGADRALAAGWARTFARERRRLRRGRSDLDDYALTDGREFLAVATEAFFMAPRRLRSRHPALHRALARAWRQDPAALADRPAARAGGPPRPDGVPGRAAAPFARATPRL